MGDFQLLFKCSKSGSGLPRSATATDSMSTNDNDSSTSTQVMSEMVGKWRLESREGNFDSFLACREVGWMMRRLMTSSSPDVEYTLSGDKSTFTKLTCTYGGTRAYPMPTGGKVFTPNKTLSGRPETGKIFETDNP